jgi:hypothetical protein
MNHLQYATIDDENSILNNLDTEKTIFFNCYASDAIEDCFDVSFELNNFVSGNEPIVINMNFSINLNAIGKFLSVNFDVVN